MVTVRIFEVMSGKRNVQSESVLLEIMHRNGPLNYIPVFLNLQFPVT
jgi:hypothetical protein